MHLLRYGTTWKYEVRWDGVETRKEALELLRARTQTAKPGDWIYILGGWAMEQFADDAKPFTRAELDRVAPNHPVFLQASYYEAFLNSRAVQLLGVDAPTGHVDEDGFRPLVNKLPVAGDADIEASSLGMIADLNRSGLTAFGSAGCEDDVLQRYRQWAGQGAAEHPRVLHHHAGRRQRACCRASRRCGCSTATRSSITSRSARTSAPCRIRCSGTARRPSRKTWRSGAAS